MKTYILLLLSFIEFGWLNGQDSLLVQHLKDNIYSLNYGEDGEGWKVLQKAMEGSQFTMLGEQHGIVEVGQMTDRLIQLSKPLGYKYLALETDPFIAYKLSSIVRKNIDSLKSFSQQFPFTIPFYDNPEDYTFLRRAVDAYAPNQPLFWGLDQVFMAAPRFLMHSLSQIATTPESKKLAKGYLQKGIEGFQKAMESGNFQETLLFQLKESDFELLTNAFADDPTGQAGEIIRELKATQQIYKHWFEGRGYLNNRDRSLLMKEHFIKYYKNAVEREDNPKVLFKFGANHVQKGLNPVGVFDLGNTVSELAELNGSHSVHIKLTGVRGQTFNSMQGVKEFDYTEDIDTSILEAIGELVNKEDWILIDLKSLREEIHHRKLRQLSDGLAFQFDYWILVPNVHPLSRF